MPARETKDPVQALLEKILLVLAIQVGSDKSISQGARLLKIAGLDNATIAKILGTTPETISTLTTGVRAWDQHMRRGRGKKRRTAQGKTRR